MSNVRKSNASSKAPARKKQNTGSKRTNPKSTASSSSTAVHPVNQPTSAGNDAVPNQPATNSGPPPLMTPPQVSVEPIPAAATATTNDTFLDPEEDEAPTEIKVSAIDLWDAIKDEEENIMVPLHSLVKLQPKDVEKDRLFTNPKKVLKIQYELVFIISPLF